LQNFHIFPNAEIFFRILEQIAGWPSKADPEQVEIMKGEWKRMLHAFAIHVLSLRTRAGRLL
jgi:hypothetical protein